MEEKIVVKSRKGAGASYMIITLLMCIFIGCIIAFSANHLEFNDPEQFLEGCVVGLLVYIIPLIIFFIIRRSEISVSNIKVSGKTAFGKRVYLPVDSISAVGTGIFKSIAVGTSAGRVKFVFIGNRNEIFEAINKLFCERQGMRIHDTADTQEASGGNTKDYARFKQLLDNGVITQEEFDAKKAKLLGL